MHRAESIAMNDDVLRETLHDLYENAPCGYVFSTPEGRLIRVNQTFVAWTGFDRDALLSRRFQDLLTVPGKMYYETHYAPLLMLQGSVQEVAFDIVREDGGRLPVLINSVLRNDAEGRPSVVASTLFSAVDRRAYERELLLARARSERLAQVVTASSDAIITASPDGEVQQWNESAESFFGYARAVFPTLNLWDLLPFDGAREQVRAALSVGDPVRADTRARASGDRQIDVSVSITPHIGDLGEIDSVSAIIRDISERRVLERMQHEFLAMASHELRTPVTAIRGHAQLMRRRGAYIERSVESIVTQTHQLSRLIDDLLLASQIEANRLELHRTDVNLVAVLRGATAALTPTGGPINLETPEEQIIISADRERLLQVFANLLANARKYSPDGAPIDVRVDPDETRVRVDIVDRGIGIDEKDLPLLFGRFFRSASVAGEIGGAGLGLFITQRIVHAHGGSIRVDSHPGSGSTFSVWFPIGQIAS